MHTDLAEKRARLVAAADLERLKLGLAWHDVRTAIAPPADASRRARVRPYVMRAVGLALPILGYRRMGRTLRTAAAALSIWRAMNAWREFSRR
ncbi:hypothetical protein BURK1_01229 [Burkholderiales bacterium]|nr:hypothetical protein BURK1_01229 [Burkholderiales bacterium]